MSPYPLKLNIAKYGDKYHKNFPDIETFKKTPKQEIEKAIKLKNQYYAEKQ